MLAVGDSAASDDTDLDKLRHVLNPPYRLKRFIMIQCHYIGVRTKSKYNFGHIIFEFGYLITQ